MWTNSIYMSILFQYHCLTALAMLTDQVGKTLNKANPTISKDVKEESEMNAAQAAKFHNYTGETHTVKTKDGYILTLFRIKSPQVCSNGKIVFLQHGLLGDSSHWNLNLPGQSSAYIFADKGYDVWLGNYRGNTYSRKHVKYSPNECEFWDFTLDHLAVYDLPAMIYYAKNTSKSHTLHYIGHSQGTTTMLMLLSMKSALTKEIRSMHFYAPVVRLRHSKSLFALAINATHELLRTFRKTEFWKRSELVVAFNNVLCGQISPLHNACDWGLDLIMGPSENQVNETRLPILHEHFPCGSGTGQLAHFAQFIRTDEFRRYDYGCSENEKKYGQREPPEYDLEQIEYKHIYLYSSDNDAIADLEDVNILYGILKKKNCVKHFYRLTARDAVFNHFDFLRSINAKSLIYRHTLEIIESYVAYRK